MIRSIQIILISIVYWIIFPIETFFAGIVIRILSLFSYDKSHKAAIEMLNMSIRIQAVQNLSSGKKFENNNSKSFWIWFYNTNKTIINLNRYVMKWAISKFLTKKEKLDSKLVWLQ